MPPQSRFSESQIADMQARYLDGQTTTSIGSTYGIHRASVYDLLKRRGVPMQSRSQSKRKYLLREEAFDMIADEPTAYWFGLLCADGCVIQRRGSGELHLVLQLQDVDHLEKYRAFLQTNAPIRKEARYETYRVSLYSLRVATALSKLGCKPSKSLSLVFPSLPSNLLRHFVRGYFDGDGSAFLGDGTPTISIVGNKDFILSLKMAIDANTNADGRMYPHTKSPVWYLIYRGQFKVPAVRDWMYNDATIWMVRKRERLDGFAPGKRSGYPTANAYVGTAGNVSAATIQKYIEAQKGT